MFGKKVYIVGEISANHGHDIQIAKDTIKAIKEAGADAVKIQTYTADTITMNCDNEYFQIKQGTLWDGTTLYKLYQEAYTPWEWHKELFDYAKEIGITIFSSPFDKSAVDLLEELNTPAYKVASFEITDVPLIKYIASKEKPVIISTGIATIGEIKEAVDACREEGNESITLLKCTSSYPAPYEEMNLLTIPNMRETFGVEVGLSDHSMGCTVALGAVALGAKFIEKHVILDRSIGGPDAEFSMEIDEFKSMVEEIRKLERALGNISYDITEKTKKNRIFSRSLFFTQDIKEGDVITYKNMRSIRPGYGMHPRHYSEILGRKVIKDIERGTPVDWSHIE
ncbi:pseudaminic acid synthase [Alkaliphilus oremlandii]|uniref:N-acylneuraminate-9-phosphate synthase n=1 Tax=Alkaliphilus oremlandii (strain OhILAs) TaxID=350688 RepID=A8MJQ9_ALKOO|nr:pseudaminic acid synthase [Alkaliphilus oremlandii]ABW20041.1 N-acylneuraminate-9-phosphate synthase [Alkaliphilus oremlandii OhILAs]